MDSFIVSGDVEDGEVDDSDQEAGHEDDDAEPRGRDDRPRSRKVRPVLYLIEQCCSFPMWDSWNLRRRIGQAILERIIHDTPSQPTVKSRRYVALARSSHGVLGVKAVLCCGLYVQRCADAHPVAPNASDEGWRDRRRLAELL